MKRIYVLWICIVKTDDPLAVLVLVLELVLEPEVLVLEPQVLDNNTVLNQEMYNYAYQLSDYFPHSRLIICGL